ncbi:hypothetical protein [Mucilaginibacter flavidus]|uniref:hypothetical protein n=1 Tax=Mucilaginibacter flavidus TaxID=2949309 RepID=UPI00209359F8|nr:hypothetical protein [Mucilaginibacter flavidus]MCO5946232.1 hypothetical protein [Mucilaginibacter flavidus]
MKAKLFIVSLLVTGIGSFRVNAQPSAKKNNSSAFFALTLKKGEKLANIYSRAIAFAGDDFAPLVFRVSGTSYYEVLDDNPTKPKFNETDLYDGRPAGNGVSQIGLDGKGTYEGKEFTNTSASGLLYSSLVWGNAPATLKEGDTWAADITVPWELGGPGKQTISVVAIDANHNTITLKRDGTSEGFFDNDRNEIEVTLKDGKKVKMNITPGTATWTGYTTFKNGIVMADELLVTRPVILTTDSLHFTASEREYILLNAMPAEK